MNDYRHPGDIDRWGGLGEERRSLPPQNMRTMKATTA